MPGATSRLMEWMTGQGNATFPGQVFSAVLQQDGKIVVTGNFFYVITGPGTNVARSCVARFNSDGTFDSTFDPGAGAVSSLGTFNTFVFYAASQNVKPNAGKIMLFREVSTRSTIILFPGWPG